MNGESPVVFECVGEQLVGVVHRGNPEATVGIVIVVGGPQYRVGSHRQFVLMARQLAAGGVPVLRFDYRGMGDSSGKRRNFRNVNEDISGAIGCFADRLPNVKQVILLGLCDAASASLMYASQDDRVSGLIILNPWARMGGNSGKFRLRHYYLPRLLNISFWQNVLSRRFTFSSFLSGLMKSGQASTVSKDQKLSDDMRLDTRSMERMLSSLEQFRRPLLLLISGRDLVGREFQEMCKTDRLWKIAVSGADLTTVEIPQADHTLTARKDLAFASDQCLEWLRAFRT